MTDTFADVVQRTLGLNGEQRAILVACGINDAQKLYALAANFPSLAQYLPLPALSNISLRSTNAAFARVATSFAAAPPVAFTFGAGYPGHGFDVGDSVPLPAIGAPSAAPGAPGASVDVDILTWPVRNQQQRGTCVAHALVACREHLCGGNPPDLSEQFMFWASKRVDGQPTMDGTWLRFAASTLDVRNDGVCLESSWPYNGTPIPTNIPQADVPSPPSPTPNAIREAKTYAIGTTTGPSLNSATIRAALSTGRPVAISVPVFQDRAAPGLQNWNTIDGLEYGVVIDPPPTSVVVGGHAVCVTGFQPDPTEGNGGYFIFRNSWGTALWARSAPGPSGSGRYVKRQGYGQISASYIDSYLWELVHL